MAESQSATPVNQYVVADTSVFLHLSRRSPHTNAYQTLIGERRLAASFQTWPELNGAGYRGERQQRVNDLLTVTLQLPHSGATNEWYARVQERRRDLRKRQFSGSDASDADVWIISSALEHRLPLLSHDKQQVALGRAMGLKVLTDLEGLRDENPPP